MASSMATSPASHNRHAGIFDARYGRVYVSDKARIAGLLIAKVSGAHPQQITDFNLGFTPNETVERLREKAHRPVTTRRSRRGASTSCTPVIGDFGKVCSSVTLGPFFQPARNGDAADQPGNLDWPRIPVEIDDLEQLPEVLEGVERQ
jgi:hypothetical protein